ncbi:DUSP19 [Branchiostoma lanceolatum]|uniref:Dual specificity protein phosphatase 12 n=1 Tax=Branchiostoma lanceolatum TaxID=7740 RepID=A0A8J9W414_BRALA|nr:DUSP19 [Branchiostoma lanceolatum]
MSLLDQLTKFSKSSLRCTETHVRTVDGREYVESRDEKGRSNLTPVGAKDYGWIGDVKPDLQVAKIRPGLFLGSQDVTVRPELLRSNNVTHVLNVAAGVETEIFPDAFTYKHVPILDLPETNITEFFPECFAFIYSGVTSGGVFVHCNAGVSRAVSIVVGYLMTTQGLNFEDAYGQVKEIRSSARPNDGFMKQLKDYKPSL